MHSGSGRKLMSTKLLCAILFNVAGGALLAAQGDVALSFTIQWLSVCDACSSNPFGITDRGTISGNVAATGGERGFLLQPDGLLTFVDTPGNFFIELLKGNGRRPF